MILNLTEHYFPYSVYFLRSVSLMERSFPPPWKTQGLDYRKIGRQEMQGDRAFFLLSFPETLYSEFPETLCGNSLVKQRPPWERPRWQQDGLS